MGRLVQNRAGGNSSTGTREVCRFQPGRRNHIRALGGRRTSWANCRDVACAVGAADLETMASPCGGRSNARRGRGLYLMLGIAGKLYVVEGIGEQRHALVGRGFTYHQRDSSVAACISGPGERASFRIASDCGYNLTGNISGTCPECGNAVPKEYLGRLVAKKSVPIRKGSTNKRDIQKNHADSPAR